MNTSTVRKICVGCGEDVSQAKRTKDAQGNYYCEMCLELRMEAMRSERAASVRPAIPPASPVAARPAREGLSRVEKTIIGVGSVVGVIIVSCAIYFLVLRDRWENQHRAGLLAFKTDAEALVRQGKLDEGKAKYEAMFGLIADRRIRDQSLQQEVDAARSAKDDISAQLTAIADRQRKADLQRQEAETRRIAAADEQRKQEEEKARVDRRRAEIQARRAEQRAEQEATERQQKEDAVDNDPVIRAFLDRNPDLERLFKRLNDRDRERINLQIQLLVSTDNLQIGDARYIQQWLAKH